MGTIWYILLVVTTIAGLISIFHLVRLWFDKRKAAQGLAQYQAVLKAQRDREIEELNNHRRW